MTFRGRSRSSICAAAAALLLTGALGAPVNGLSDDPDAAAAEMVLLANDGVLPLDPDRALAVITAHSAEAGGTSLAEELDAADVVDLGPALPVELGALAPVPAEVLTTAGGEAGLTAELFARPDFTEPLEREQVPGVVRGTHDDSLLDDAAAVRWTGRLTAPADGSYTLSLVATGDSTLTVDGVDAPAPVSQLRATGDDAAAVHTEPVELDLTAGAAVEIEVEQSDPGPHPQAVLGWHAPEDVAPEAETEAVDAAGAADAVIIHVPAVVDARAEVQGGAEARRETAEDPVAAEADAQREVGEGAGEEPEGAATGEALEGDGTGEELGTAVPGALPVDHARLVQRVAEVNPRTVVVLDAAADRSLFTWLDDVAAVVHVPAAAADIRLLADLLDGTLAPSGVLAEPLQPAEDHAPQGESDEASELGFPVGFGLTYEDLTDEPDGEPTAEPADGLSGDLATDEPDGAPPADSPGEPTAEPAGDPTGEPAPDATGEPTEEPSTDPTGEPAPDATDGPTASPVDGPTAAPSPEATGEPTVPEQVRGEPGGDAGTPPARSGSIAITGRVPGDTPGLYLSVATSAAALGEAQFLDDRWQLRGALPAITVVDSRDDRQTGWTVSAQMSDLTGAAQVLPAGSVGWTPSLSDVVDGVTAGPSVATLLSGGPGLAESAVLGRAVEAAPPGRTELGADLVLETGYDTAPGRYAGSLTVTIFPTETD